MIDYKDIEKHSIARYDPETKRVSITCNKGLWGVDAPTFEQALSEAMHYYLQYLDDGEYDDEE